MMKKNKIVFDKYLSFIQKWYKSNAEKARVEFNWSPYSGAEKELHNLIGQQVPTDLVGLYSICNGQPITEDPSINRFLASCYAHDYRLMDVSEIMVKGKNLNSLFADGRYDRLIQSDKEVRAKWWSKGWLPFLSNGCGDFICVDTNPSDYGTQGQIIEFVHDDVSRKLLSSSLNKFFSEYINALECGAFYVSNSSGWILPHKL